MNLRYIFSFVTPASRQELFLVCGERRIRTSEVVRQQIYSLPQLATLVSPRYVKELRFTSVDAEPMEGFEPPTS